MATPDHPAFESRNPAEPGFWSERVERGFMPWDQGGVPDALRHFVKNMTSPGTVLIPGCGTGYEVALLSAAGCDVTAIDFSPAAVAAAKEALGPLAERVIQADFFTFAPPRTLDLIYERAFLCALPRALWPKVVERWASLLPAEGRLAGFFYFDAAPKGPPFGASRDSLQALLQPDFIQEEDLPVGDSIPVFAGKERWQVWRRR